MMNLNKPINKSLNRIILALMLSFVISWVLFFVFAYFATKDDLSDSQFVVGPHVEEEINNYLVKNVGFSSFGGEVFCAFEQFGSRIKGVEGVDLYVWVLCSEYYINEHNHLAEGGGLSGAKALTLVPAKGGYKVLYHQPAEGASFYVGDIESIFPEQYHKFIFHDVHRSPTINRSIIKVLNQAKDYYGR